MPGKKSCLCVLAVTAAVASLLLLSARPPRPVTVRTARVTRGSVRQELALSGRLRFRDTVEVVALQSGVIRQVDARTGDAVSQGQALLRLDAAEAENTLRTCLALAEQVSSLAADTTLGTGEPDSTEPPLAKWTEALLQGREALEGTVLRAPRDGVVRQVYAAAGSAVAAGTPVMQLSGREQEVLCTVTATEAKALRVSQSAYLLDGEERVGTATVSAVGPLTADPMTGQLLCEVTLLAQSPIALPAGTRLEARVYLAGNDSVPLLPVEALTDRETVWWIADGRCVEVDAGVVLADEMSAWVTLPEGLTVALGEQTEGAWVREADP